MVYTQEKNCLQDRGHLTIRWIKKYIPTSEAYEKMVINLITEEKKIESDLDGFLSKKLLGT